MHIFFLTDSTRTGRSQWPRRLKHKHKRTTNEQSENWLKITGTVPG
jgi:hypothetical protein